MVSGSSALPERDMLQWNQISGQVILERFGMTETGMVLSNTIESRRPGSVGVPLPGVKVLLMDPDTLQVIRQQNTPGELLVTGESLFSHYLNLPDATESSFITIENQKYFKTGDFAVQEHDTYRLLGRLSQDIIKKQGHKLSALEIEGQIMEGPQTEQVAVVGIDCPKQGQELCAFIVIKQGFTLEQVKDYCL